MQFMESIGFSPVDPESTVDIAETDRYTVILEGNVVIGFYIDDKPFPSVKGLLRAPPEKKFVTVDMGAVKFVASGADVMAPGVTDADGSILEGDTVWIRDVNNKKPLAIGIALRSGEAMTADKKGKAVKSIHHVGDDIWNIGH